MTVALDPATATASEDPMAKRGRPPLTDEDARLVDLGVRLPASLVARVKAKAGTKRGAVSALVRRYVTEGLTRDTGAGREEEGP